MLDLWKPHWRWKAKRYCHITEKFRAAAHWICNVNLKLTKRVYVIFHGLKGYDCHLAMIKLISLM